MSETLEKPNLPYTFSEKVEGLLAKDELTAWQKAKYLIVLSVLGGISLPFLDLMSLTYSRPPLIVEAFKLASEVAAVIITIIGVKKCLKINGSIDNRDFIERFIILSVPVSIKIMILGVPIILLLKWIVTRFMMGNPSLHEYAQAFFYIIGIAGFCLYYFLLKRSFLRLGEKIRGNAQTGYALSPIKPSCDEA